MKKAMGKWGKALAYAGGGETADDTDTETEDEAAVPEVASSMDPAVAKALQAAMLSGKMPEEESAEEESGRMPAAEPSTPATSQDNVMSLRERLEQYLNQQQNRQSSLQQLADQYGQQLDEKKNNPNHSALNRLADFYYGTNFSKDYERPPTEDEATLGKLKAQEAVAKAGDPIAQELLKQYGTDNNAVSKAQASYYKQATQHNRDLANSIPTGLVDEMGQPIILNPKQGQTAKQMHDAMFLGRGSNSQVQQSIGKLRSGAQFENLVAALPNGEVTPQDMSDLTSALGQTVNGTNVLTDHRFASLYPNDLPKTAASVVQWLSGNPKGVDQTKWINRWLNEVQAEKTGALKTVSKWVDAQKEYYKSAGLPERFVEKAGDSAKKFYAEGYEPVAGIGKFSPTGPGGMQPQEPTVKVLAPDGKVRLIPQSKLDQAVQSGGKVVK